MRSSLVALSPVALAVVVALAVGVDSGGCGNCSACPTSTVVVTASANVDLDIRNLTWTGPACPPYPPLCRGDDTTTSCTHLFMPGFGEGECALTITFGSGLVQVVHAQFGTQTKSCCGGFPVVGEATFVIPVDKDAGVFGADGPTDAVTTVDLDAGADAADGGADAAGADDAGVSDAGGAAAD